MHRLALGALALLIIAQASPADARRRKRTKVFHVELVRVINDTKDCPIEAHAKKRIIEMLEASPKITSDKKKKSRGTATHRIQLRIAKCSHQLTKQKPPKVYKLLMVDIKTSLDAEKHPTRQMALAGSGSAQVGVETNELEQEELTKLRKEAADAAIKQALEQFIAKLGDKPPQKRKRRRRRKR